MLVARVNFSTKTHKKRKEFCWKKIIEDLADAQTVNNVNNDIDLSAGSMNNDINSSVWWAISQEKATILICCLVTGCHGNSHHPKPHLFLFFLNMLLVHIKIS